MKGFKAILLIAVFLFSFNVFASTTNYGEGVIQKVKHGGINTLTGWLEVPFQVVKGYNNGIGDDHKFKLVGGFCSIFRGIAYGIGRTTSGIVSLATFLLPNPKSNQGVGIPLDAEYVWEKGTQYSIFKDGIKPVGKKALRGLIDTAAAIADFPGQIIKGFNEAKPVIGFGKAIVFPMGRIIYGAYSLATFAFPNPVDNYGYPIEEKYPWDALAGDCNNQL